MRFHPGSWPTKMKFISAGTDGWSYWKVMVNGQTILEDPNGETGRAYDNNPYWIDGDGSSGPVEQILDLPDKSGRSIASYELVAGEGSTHNHLFTLETNGTLKTAAILDRETTPSLNVRVKAIDDQGEAVEKTFAISVNNQFEFDLSSSTVAENLPSGRVVGDFNGLVDVELSAHTSNRSNANTSSPIMVSFLVNGTWTTEETFFTGASIL